jgi:predicted nucleic acid-binding protein
MADTEVFLDTAYAIALSAPGDSHHTQAVSLARWIEASSIRLVTTRAIMLEIGNALARARYRRAAVELLDAIENDEAVEIVALSEALWRRAYRLYRDRDDKEWGMVDCVSFIVMEDRSITDALTTDEHFQQAGFRALLRDTP